MVGAVNFDFRFERN